MTSPCAHTALRVLALMIASATAIAIEPEQKPIGRLFFTPEQRGVLDQQTRTDTPAGEPQANALRFDGKVLGSNGQNTYWLNGKPQTSPEGIPAQLQVGEAVDVSSGNKRPLLDDGALRIHRRRQPRQPPRQEARESQR